MSKGVYIGVAGKARKVKNIYIGVGGKARKVKKAYIGVAGKARLIYSAWNGELYSAGNDFSDVTGGWIATTQKYTGTVEGLPITGLAPTLTTGDSSLTAKLVNSSYVVSGTLRASNMIDLTDFSAIKVQGTLSASHPYSRLYVIDSTSENYTNADKYAQLVNGATTLDVSALSGKYYVAIGIYTSGTTTFEMTSCIMS